MGQVTLDIRKTYDCDVLVVGAGVSGIAAAVTAARDGARVILCDRGGVLGGTATKSLVGPFMSCYDRKGEVQIIRGFFEEFVCRMIDEGGAISHKECRGGDSRSGYRSRGHIGVTPFSSEVLKLVADAVCREAGVRVFCHSTLIGCDVADGTIRSAYFANMDGVDRVNAKVFIDTTGNASLCARAGAETFRGDENGFVQTATTFFQITDVDREKLDAYMAVNTEMPERFFMKEIEAARVSGEFPCGTQKLRIYEGMDGIWNVNMAQEDGDVNDLDVEALTEAEARQRLQIRSIFRFLKNNIPGLENIRMTVSASDMGIRESRRMVGRSTLTGEDVAARRYAEEQVVVCANSIDIHQSVGVAYTTYSCDENYYIPLSCLLSKDISNLMAAGKCMSADKYAFAAVRVMPPCFGMGEAVGHTAALAVKKGITPDRVSVAEVQQAILANGGYLEL